nr:glutathione S-transferase epsilon 14 [Spodoptera exigua]
MGVKLYAMDYSPPSRACMMACEIFEVPFEKIPVNLFKGDHLTPEYLEKNPLHTIPVLEDGDFILYDSHAIMAYLADTYGKDESWYPKDVKKRALVNQKLFFNTAVIYRRLRNITYYVFQQGKKTLEQDWLDDIAEGYSFLEAFLSKTKYIAGDNITIADIAILSHLATLEYILPIDAKKYPKTSAWLEDFKATPYAKKHNEEGAKALYDNLKKHLTS